jgi:hypothetical protein
MDTNLHPAAGVIVKSDQAVSISVSHNFSFEIGNSRENSPKEPSSVHTPCPEKTEAQSTASKKLIFSVSRSFRMETGKRSVKNADCGVREVNPARTDGSTP